MAVGLEAIRRDLQIHAGKARLRIGGVTLAAHAAAIRERVGVMEDAGVARADLDRAHEPPSAQRHRQHEVAEHIAALGRQRPGAVGREHQIGGAELPSGGEDRRGGQIGCGAFDGALLHPSSQRRNLRRISRRSPLKVAMAFHRRPGRHDALAGDLHDLPGPAPHVRVRQQRKRARASVVVAWRAVGEDDRRDIAREGHTLGRRGRSGDGRAEAAAEPTGGAKRQHHENRRAMHGQALGYLRSAISQPAAGVATNAGALWSSVGLEGVAQIESGGAWPLAAQLGDAVVDAASIGEARFGPVEHVDRRFRRDVDTRPPHQRMIGIANRRRPKAILTPMCAWMRSAGSGGST